MAIARFVTSASKLEQCPDFGGRPEFAIVGRSNVGKSSLINALAKQDGLAITSRTPGRTRLINFFDFGRFLLADLPGYGYAKVSKAEQAKWKHELSRYLAERTALHGVVHLMDARHPLTANDMEMRSFLMEHELPILVVLTKADDTKQGERLKAVARVAALTGQDPLLVSSRTGKGRDELFRMLRDGAPTEDDGLAQDQLDAEAMAAEEARAAEGARPLWMAPEGGVAGQ